MHDETPISSIGTSLGSILTQFLPNLQIFKGFGTFDLVVGPIKEWKSTIELVLQYLRCATCWNNHILHWSQSGDQNEAISSQILMCSGTLDPVTGPIAAMQAGQNKAHNKSLCYRLLCLSCHWTSHRPSDKVVLCQIRPEALVQPYYMLIGPYLLW